MDKVVFHLSPDLAILVNGVIDEAAQAGTNAAQIGPQDIPTR